MENKVTKTSKTKELSDSKKVELNRIGFLQLLKTLPKGLYNMQKLARKSQFEGQGRTIKVIEGVKTKDCEPFLKCHPQFKLC